MSPDSSDPDRPTERAEAAPAAHPGPPAPPAAVPSGAPALSPVEGPVEPPVEGPVEPPVEGRAGPGAAYASLLRLHFDEPRLPGRRVAGLVGAVVLGMTLLGAPLGLLWVLVAPATPVIKITEGAIYAEPQPEQPIAADGWFSLLGLGFGVLAAVALWYLLRALRGPAGLLAVTVGGLGAALVAWQVGRRIGWSTYQRLLAEAPPGQSFDKPVDLRAGGVDRVLGVLPVPYGNVLLVAFGGAVVYTLLAGWSRWPSLHPEPDLPPDLWPAPTPGFGPGPPGPGPGPLPGAGAAGVSWGTGASPAPSTAPEPPAPDAAEPPRG
ncbi:hypothetical protein AWW66_13785 [Micromonospora rosaria]|uniref:DUF2567 domain-containing protein n=1 Tax=Micromonospora rosaria TaxID=47874 RepID=A0A136PSH1_9ACTN|nr:hypothetical protein AWW66_13785 [Micromonospora rosaria]